MRKSSILKSHSFRSQGVCSHDLHDQATGIRHASRQSAPVLPLPMRAPHVQARTLAVTSGKGGVGKTQVAANLAIAAAQRGQRVVLLDADLGLASLDLALGLRPERNLLSVIEGSADVSDILVPGPAGIQLIPACPGRYDMANLDPLQRHRLSDAVEELALAFDLLVIDTGAGIGSNAVSFAARGEVILVTTADPGATRDAYAMAKVLHRRSGIDHMHLIANQVQSEAEGLTIYNRLNGIVERFLTLEMSYLGCIPYDNEVIRSLRSGSPYMLEAPASIASRATEHIASKLCPTRSTFNHGIRGLC